jgi:hypothetical protein
VFGVKVGQWDAKNVFGGSVTCHVCVFGKLLTSKSNLDTTSHNEEKVWTTQNPTAKIRTQTSVCRQLAIVGVDLFYDAIRDSCDAGCVMMRRILIILAADIFPSVRVHYFTIASNTETDKEFLLAFSMEVRIYRYKYI